MSPPYWTPEIQCTAQVATALIDAQFPALSPARVKRIGHGMDNAAFLVNGAYIFRFPQRAISAPLLAIEAAVLPEIARLLPIAVPVPEFFGMPQDRYPWNFAGYRMLAGHPLDGLRPDAAQRGAHAGALGAFLKVLHAVDPAPAIARGLPGDMLRRLDHGHRFPLAKSRLLDLAAHGLLEDACAFIDWLEHNPPRWTGTEPVSIVHGDLYARHLLAGDDGVLTGVIDWGDVHAGDKALDVMIAHAFVPAAAHGAFISAYGGVDELCWQRAKYRAIYHAVLVADYAHAIGDASLLHAGLDALENLRAAL